MCSHYILLRCCSRNISLNSVVIKPSSYSFLSEKECDPNLSLFFLPCSAAQALLPSVHLTFQAMSIAFLPPKRILQDLLNCWCHIFPDVVNPLYLPLFWWSLIFYERHKLVPRDKKEETVILERQTQ